MKHRKSVGLLMAFAFAAAFAPDVAAQASPDAHSGAVNVPKPDLPDMRLWSFGDCDDKFPYFNSAEHQECVRVVGSAEARDARAYRVCETSNPRDYEEVARCKSTYKANKDRSAQSGYVPNTTPQQQAVPTVEELQRVRAIATAGVEQDKAAAHTAKVAAAVENPAASAAKPGPQPEPEEPSGPSTLVIALSIAAALGGTAAYIQRRKQSNSFSAR